jgi:hypothetical protein
VLNGTVLYWSTESVTGTVNASDFTDGLLTGSVTINSNTASISRTLTSDATTEGAESFRLQLRTVSVSGTVVATSSNVTINDTSAAPTYSITPTVTSVNEGGSVTFNISTTNVPNSTVLYWNTASITGTVNASDFTGGLTSGSVTINSGTASVLRTLASDLTTEGTEEFRLTLRTGSTIGTIVATSSIVTVNDTSLTPPGQVLFTSSTTGFGTATASSWTVPAGVNSISMLCIGGGGGGRSFTASAVSGGGGGGALAYVNNFAVTPGTVVTINVGNGGSALQTATTNANKSGDGGISLVSIGGVIRCRAGGGTGAYGTNTSTQGGFGGSVLNGVGGIGGRGGVTNTSTTSALGGGGGAGGYGSVGGIGGQRLGGTTASNAGTSTTGGGGGGGYKTWIVSNARAGHGGGTGVLGQGSNGTAGTNATASNATAAGNGGAGSGGSAKLYGGGGGGGFNMTTVTELAGGSGAVRIMWPGNLRQYPSTRTANE